jgi:hypothetical protein
MVMRETDGSVVSPTVRLSIWNPRRLKKSGNPAQDPAWFWTRADSTNRSMIIRFLNLGVFLESRLSLSGWEPKEGEYPDAGRSEGRSERPPGAFGSDGLVRSGYLRPAVS